MAKRGKYHHRKASLAHKATSAFADFLIAGPITVPALLGGQAMLNGNSAQDAIARASVYAFNYNPTEGKFGSSAQTTEIIVRDAALIVGGLAMKKFVVRKIR